MFRRRWISEAETIVADQVGNLKWVTMEEGTMPNLEKLTLRHCELLRMMPSGIKRLSSLRAIVFDDMPRELSMRPNQEIDAI